MRNRLLLFVGFMLLSSALFAQRSYYTVMQLGGQLGIANKGYQGSFNGYAINFIFGRNFDDRAFLGLGFGNETFRGSYQTKDPQDRDQTRRDYDTYMMPIFIDGRLPIAYVGENSRIGLLANGGYAPKIGPVYDKGFLFKGGVFYLYETLRRTDFLVSAAYGYQQLTHNMHDPSRNFQHQHLNISVGIMLK